MAATGDDCYYYYYSKCTKGDSCPYRHVAAALRTEITCTGWTAGTCFRPGCIFRHAEITKDRPSIPCYFESQPGGCQKPHCVYRHVRQTGNTTGADRTQKTVSPEEVFAVPQLTQVETMEVKVPSPKVDPVVVTFDEESDQESCGGSPVKAVVPQRLKEIQVPTRPKVVALHKGPEKEQEAAGVQFAVKSLEDLRKDKLEKAKKMMEEAKGLFAEIESSIQSLPEPAKTTLTRKDHGFSKVQDTEPAKITLTRKDHGFSKIQDTGGSSVGVKSLEDIQREKALASMMRNRAAQAAKKASSDNGVTEVVQQPGRRFIVSEDAPPAISQPAILRLRDRLGPHPSSGEDSDLESRTQTARRGVRHRLGPTPSGTDLSEVSQPATQPTRGTVQGQMSLDTTSTSTQPARISVRSRLGGGGDSESGKIEPSRIAIKNRSGEGNFGTDSDTSSNEPTIITLKNRIGEKTEQRKKPKTTLIIEERISRESSPSKFQPTRITMEETRVPEPVRLRVRDRLGQQDTEPTKVKATQSTGEDKGVAERVRPSIRDRLGQSDAEKTKPARITMRDEEEVKMSRTHIKHRLGHTVPPARPSVRHRLGQTDSPAADSEDESSDSLSGSDSLSSSDSEHSTEPHTEKRHQRRTPTKARVDSKQERVAISLKAQIDSRKKRLALTKARADSRQEKGATPVRRIMVLKEDSDEDDSRTEEEEEEEIQDPAKEKAKALAAERREKALRRANMMRAAVAEGDRKIKAVSNPDDDDPVDPVVTFKVRSLADIRREKEARLGGATGNVEVERKSAPRATRQPRFQLYQPPALKIKVQEERRRPNPPKASPPRVSPPKASPPKASLPRNKSTEWGLKTYSEIMREKMLKREAEQQARTGATQPKQLRHSASESTLDEVSLSKESKASKFKPIVFDADDKSNDSQTGASKRRRKFAPVTFDITDNSERKRGELKRKFTPVVFGDGDNSSQGTDRKQAVSSEQGETWRTAKQLRSNITSVKSEPGRENITDTHPKITPSLHTISRLSGQESPETEAAGQKRLSEPSPTRPVINLPSIRTAPLAAVKSEVMSPKAVVTSPKGVVTSPHFVKGKVTRRSTSQSDDQTSGTKAPGVSNYSTDDSFFDEDLQDLLGDVGDISHTRIDSQNEDDLLLEMEELLA